MRFLLSTALAIAAAAAPAHALTLDFTPGTFIFFNDGFPFNAWQAGNFIIAVSEDGTIANGVATGSIIYFQYTVGDKLIPLNSFDIQGTGSVGVQTAVEGGPVSEVPIVTYALTGAPQTIVVDPKIPGFNFRFTASEGQITLDNLQFGSTVPVPDPNAGVPEPATWAMMIAGFGLAGAAVRRRSPRRLAA